MTVPENDFNILKNQLSSSPLDEFKGLLNKGPASLTSERITEWFDRIAFLIGNQLCIRAGEARFRIVEIEFYYKAAGHNDLYCHDNRQQKKAGNWYYHAAGVDITIGNPSQGTCGGILIRGVSTIPENDETSNYDSGPIIALDEMQSCLGSVFEGAGLKIETYDYSDLHTPITHKRIGLKPKEKDNEDFLSRELRYILDLTPSHKFKNLEAVHKKRKSLTR